MLLEVSELGVVLGVVVVALGVVGVVLCVEKEPDAELVEPNEASPLAPTLVLDLSFWKSSFVEYNRLLDLSEVALKAESLVPL